MFLRAPYEAEYFLFYFMDVFSKNVKRGYQITRLGKGHGVDSNCPSIYRHVSGTVQCYYVRNFPSNWPPNKVVTDVSNPYAKYFNFVHPRYSKVIVTSVFPFIPLLLLIFSLAPDSFTALFIPSECLTDGLFIFKEEVTIVSIDWHFVFCVSSWYDKALYILVFSNFY